MSLEEIPIHSRQMSFDAFDLGNQIEVRATLNDSRPWAKNTNAVEVVHYMTLNVKVMKKTLEIVSAGASLESFPHFECPSIAPSFEQLVGLNVGRGYTRQVQSLFGRQLGCTHLEMLARALGPVVIQAVTSQMAYEIAHGKRQDLIGDQSIEAPWSINTCHVWAEDGVAIRKLRAGWRPGTGPYPTPELKEIENLTQPG